jgi:aryl-alcohol dehydrogenase-like predicted oxidoreductase
VRYHQLGSSGLKVSALSFGTMTFGGRNEFAQAGNTDVEGARRQVELCLEAGVNLFDTADAYSAGRSEEILGEAIRGRRDELLLATKCGMNVGPTLNDRGLSRHHIVRSCEGSLRRLGVDHIDLYQVHSWDGQTPLEETLAALDDLVSAGKVRYTGCSNYSAWQLMKALGISDRQGLTRFACQQIYYSLQAREAEYELVPASVAEGLGILVWSPLAGGLLSGKYRRGVEPPAGSRHLTEWNEPPVRDPEQLHDTVDVLVAVAEELATTPAAVALAWLLARPAVSSLVIGARTEEQLSANLAAADLELSDEQTARLQAVSAPALLYPYWHQRQTVYERLSPADLTLLAQ